MREELLKQQKELLELQKRKVELELLQTKAILEEQQKKLENQAASLISEPLVCAVFTIIFEFCFVLVLFLFNHSMFCDGISSRGR